MISTATTFQVPPWCVRRLMAKGASSDELRAAAQEYERARNKALRELNEAIRIQMAANSGLVP